MGTRGSSRTRHHKSNSHQLDSFSAQHLLHPCNCLHHHHRNNSSSSSSSSSSSNSSLALHTRHCRLLLSRCFTCRQQGLRWRVWNAAVMLTVAHWRLPLMMRLEQWHSAFRSHCSSSNNNNNNNNNNNDNNNNRNNNSRSRSTWR